MLFKSLGLLGSADVVECSASDFVTGYANQASGKTRQVFEKALGQVLFIDEAYRSGGQLRVMLSYLVQACLPVQYMCINAGRHAQGASQ